MSTHSAQQVDPLAPYEAIVAHAELELELAGDADLERLAALAPLWEELTAALPATPPPAAAVLLERAGLIHARARVELLRIRDLLSSELATVRRGRRRPRATAGRPAREPRSSAAPSPA